MWYGHAYHQKNHHLRKTKSWAAKTEKEETGIKFWKKVSEHNNFSTYYEYIHYSTPLCYGHVNNCDVYIYECGCEHGQEWWYGHLKGA
jgi:hypothetical protein